MKLYHYQLIAFLLWISLLAVPRQVFAQKTPEITLEKVAEKCKGLARDKRVVVKVARFSVSTKSAQANSTFGDELATMLTSAIQQTNCFRVMEMNRNAGDATGEMAFAQDGFTDGSGPAAGKMVGAQLVVTGEVTDFSEGNKSTQVGAFNFGGNTATLGFTLKLLNPQTSELLFSRDINMKGNSSGFRGMNLGGANGLKIGGSTENRAVQDAVQKAIIRAVEVMVDAKDQIEMPEPMKLKEIKRYTAQNCQMLRNGSPKVIILVTEATTAGTARDNTTTDLNRREREIELKEREANIGVTRDIVQGIFGRRREEPKKSEEMTSRQTGSSAVFKPVIIEQSATETELIRQFVEAGFRVVDPKIYGKMRQIADSSADLAAMASLGLKMGANIIITGQTISERTNSQGGMVSCRARLEIRAIATEDGSILASNAIAGGGLDVSEAVANKIAIRTASENMTQYLLERLCAMNMQFASVGGGVKTAVRTAAPAASVPAANVTDIAVTNTTYAKLSVLAELLKKNPKVKSVQKSLKGSADGTLHIEHLGSTDELVDTLGKNPTAQFEVTSLEESKASLKMN
ncbi:CsgG/HfaB family protein [Spirosoma sp.]|uniref:CsgG/HfaB family protein n=1 Tax=Spirosoma sp. TaxID=1899569 RepID=UPI003B3B88AD